MSPCVPITGLTGVCLVVITVCVAVIGWCIGMRQGVRIANRVWSERTREATDEIRRRRA